MPIRPFAANQAFRTESIQQVSVNSEAPSSRPRTRTARRVARPMTEEQRQELSEAILLFHRLSSVLSQQER